MPAPTERLAEEITQLGKEIQENQKMVTHLVQELHSASTGIKQLNIQLEMIVSQVMKLKSSDKKVDSRG